MARLGRACDVELQSGDCYIDSRYRRPHELDFAILGLHRQQPAHEFTERGEFIMGEGDLSCDLETFLSA
jgi:hypothetical protein